MVLRRAGTQPEDEAKKLAGTNGHTPAVIWEAFLDIQQEGLIEWLWDCCEAFLSERGAERVSTPSHDPTYESDRYRRFLRDRGYVPISGRADKATGQAAMAWMEKNL